MRGWFTTGEVARIYGVSPAHVRNVACRLGWPRRRLGRSVAYPLPVVEAWNRGRTRRGGLDMT